MKKNPIYGFFLVLFVVFLSADFAEFTSAYAMKGGKRSIEEISEGDSSTATAPKRRRMYQVRSPLYDSMFKKVFKKPACLIDLLNSILDLQGPDRITTVDYLSEEFPSKEAEIGKLIFDIHCQTNNGKTFIVEMQKGLIQGMTKRLELYSAKALNHQWDLLSSMIKESGQKWDSYKKYNSLSPIRTIAFLDYTDDAFKKNPGYFIHPYEIQHTETHNNDFPLQRWILVDLVGLREAMFEGKIPANIPHSSARWLRFLTRVDGEKVEVEETEGDPLLVAYRAISKLTTAEIQRLEEEEKNLADLHAHLDAAETVGMEKGMEKGVEKGIEQGEKNKTIEIAKSLIVEKASDEMIIKVTNLTEDDLHELRKTLSEQK